MIYSFSLYTMGLLVGALLIVSHAVALLHADGTRRFLQRLPRSKEMGGVLLGLQGAANSDPRLTRVFSTFSATTPMLYLDVDRDKAQMLRVPLEQGRLFGGEQLLHSIEPDFAKL